MCLAADLNILRGGQKTHSLPWTVPSYVLTAMFYGSTVLSFASQEVLPASKAGDWQAWRLSSRGTDLDVPRNNGPGLLRQRMNSEPRMQHTHHFCPVGGMILRRMYRLNDDYG